MTGLRRWLRAYGLMVRWEFTSLRIMIPVTAAVQVLAGAGMVLGIGLLRDVPRPDALYLAGGSAVVTLTLVGLVIGPQIITQQKMNGSYEYLWSMPVPRTAAMAAWSTTTVLMGLPGAAAAVAVAAWRYHLTFHYGWSGVAAVLLTATTGTMIGYALGHAVRNTAVVVSSTQVLIFVLIGFSPVNFPADRLPGWLDRVNDFLPFEPMSTVVRGAFVPEVAGPVGGSYLVLAGWLVVMTAVSAAVLLRRR